MDFDSLRHFLCEVPDLRRLLSSTASSDEELMLREAMRRTVADLATVLHDAAAVETAPMCAAVLQGTSRIAEEVAACNLQRAAADH